MPIFIIAAQRISLPVIIEMKNTYSHLDDLGHAGPGGLQHGGDVLAALLGLLADGALDEVAVGVGGDLARDEDLAVGLDGLRLW